MTLRHIGFDENYRDHERLTEDILLEIESFDPLFDWDEDWDPHWSHDGEIQSHPAYYKPFPKGRT